MTSRGTGPGRAQGRHGNGLIAHDASLRGAAHVDIAGERLWLLPDRAVWWPAATMLLVADVHFGKAAAFRALGQPVPAGTTGDNLARLSALVAHHAVRHLVFLGDFLHARMARTPAVLAALQAWRDGLPPELRCTLVRGNHDAHAGDPPPSLRIAVVPEPLRAGPFALRHMPRGADDGYVLAGHLHPAFTLRSGGARGANSLRLPCFVFGTHGAILPAFGEFTGHATITPEPGERVFVIGDRRVWALGRGV